MAIAAPTVALARGPAVREGHPAVRIRSLDKRFAVARGWREILRVPFHREYVDVLTDVNCEIQPAELFGWLGPNGAGKTTLFKILATLVTPDRGEVTVGGFNVTSDAPSVRRMLAPVIADERSLHWRLSAGENLRLFAVLQGLESGSVDRRVNELLELVDLRHAKERQVGTFSSGMKQRLLIARALIPQPQVLLLDEPTRSLDPISAQAFRAFLRDEVCGVLGCTVLLATHDAEEAFELCDRVAILNHGRILATGPAGALAKEFGQEFYLIWTRSPHHPAFQSLSQRGLVRIETTNVDSVDGWTGVKVEIPGGYGRASDVVKSLVSEGVSVARFEQVDLPLADLIQHVLESRAG